MARISTATVRASLLLLAMCVLPGMARAVEEAELKAAIVYNILMFVSWPPETLPPGNGPVRLCVSASNPTSAAIRALQGRDVGAMPLEVAELSSTTAKPCHAVFVDASDRIKSAASLAAQRAHGALVLSDDPEAPTDTTAVVLLRTGARLSFEVNLQSVRQAGIRLSSKLLRLARTVRE